MRQHSGHDRSRENARRLDDRFRRGLAVSLGLHVLGLTAAAALPGMFPDMGGALWGDPDASGGIRVTIAGDFGGIPLPRPEVVNETAAGNESEGFFESEPLPAPAPVEAEPDAVAIPETPATAETRPAPEPEPAAPPTPRDEPDDDPPAERPDNAVPFGEGGQLALPFGNAGAGDGTGLSLGDGAFGERYGRYVESIRRRISEAWIQGRIPANVRTAPRVWVTFDIERNGDITNIAIDRSSGNDALDRSARRAVFAARNLGPLPADYRGARVRVRFWFELRR